MKRNVPNILVGSIFNRKFKSPVNEAMIIFESGPANAVIAVPTSLFWKLYSFIGTGLLHPKRKRIIHIAPMGSIWVKGFNVSLPAAFAVGSPNL